MGKTMNAAVMTTLGLPPDIRQVVIPEIGPGQTPMRVHASAVGCTDLHAAEGDRSVKPSAPFVAGQEGHMAVHCAKAVGMHIVAVDNPKLTRDLGADEIVNAAEADPAEVAADMGGGHGASVTAVLPKTSAQAVEMLQRRGTMSLVGLPPGKVPPAILPTVFRRLTIRGSIVGKLPDLSQAKMHFTWNRLDTIAAIFERPRQGTIDRRVVLRV